jgi:hypothetical protein
MPDSFAVYLKVIIEADNAKVAEDATVANMDEVPGEVYVEKVVTLAADRIPWSESPYGAVEVGYDQP